VAAALGNTPAITRKSYIHPLLVSAARGDVDLGLDRLRLPRRTRWLSREERGLLTLLDNHAPLNGG
ncbi:MAG: DNA topoisomerase IB, partial [Sphingomonas sp.]